MGLSLLLLPVYSNIFFRYQTLTNGEQTSKKALKVVCWNCHSSWEQIIYKMWTRWRSYSASCRQTVLRYQMGNFITLDTGYISSKSHLPCYMWPNAVPYPFNSVQWHHTQTQWAHLTIAHGTFANNVYPRDQSQILVGVCVNTMPITDLRAYVTAQTWIGYSKSGWCCKIRKWANITLQNTK